MQTSKKRTKICIAAGLAMIATASGVAFAKSERYTVTAASVPTNGYVETITLQDLKVDHWGTPNSATEKTTDDPIYDGFTATGKYSMPVGTPGQRHLNGAYGAKGSWKYVSSTAGTFGYKFKMDFGDGDFTGCLNFSIGDTAIGIFDDRFATVGKRWNVASTDADRYVEYSKTYTGIQDVSIQYQCVSPTAEDTVDDALGKLYVLTIGADEYQIYHAYDGNSWHPIEFGNYTNEVIDLYQWDYVVTDEWGVPLGGYIADVPLQSLEEKRWGTPNTATQKTTDDPIYDAFSSSGKYSMPSANTGAYQYLAAYSSKGDFAYLSSTAGSYGYKFKMDFGDGDFTGCLYFGIGNTAVGIFDDRVATVGWCGNTASTANGRYATYNKTYTGVQAVSIKYQCVYTDSTASTALGKLYTFTIGEDTYKLYYAYDPNDWDKVAIGNYTNETLDLYRVARDGMSSSRGYSISLDGDIAINCYVDLEDVVTLNENAKFVFTRASGATIEKLVKDAECEGTVYKFKISLPANCVNETVKGQVVVGETKGAEYSYSIQSYANYVLENSSDEALKALVSNMMVYGESAQAYFAGETVATVDANVNQSATTTITGSDANIDIAGATLVLESRTAIRIYFNLKNGATIEDISCKVGTEAVTPVLKNEETQLYYVEVSVAAKDLNREYEISMGGYTLTYCALTYVATVVNTEGANVNLQNLVKALYNYSVAADNYFV